MDLGAYRDRAQAFATALGREHHRHFAGIAGHYDPAAIFAAYADLFDDRALEGLRAAGPEARGLLAFCVDGRLTEATAAFAAERAIREANLRVIVEGMALGLSQAVAVQAADPDPERRARIQEARLNAIEADLAPVAQECAAAAQAAAQELGWASLVDLWTDVMGVDLRALATDAAAFVERTAASFGPAVDAALIRTSGAPLARARQSDLPAFFRQAWADSVFPGEQATDDFAATARDLGLDIRRLNVDVAPRSGKSARAFCAAVRVPEEVHLVASPSGAIHEYTAVMHEGGHALDLVHTDPALPFEARHLGDPASTEAFAFLFEGLVADSAWRRRHLGSTGPEGHLAVHDRATRLVMIRRHAGLLAHEVDLLGPQPSSDPPAHYAKQMTRTIGIEWPLAAWARDADVRFTTATYLRGWALAAQLRRHLRDDFGEAWFAKPAAGAVLRQWWNGGRRADANQLAHEATGSALSFDALADELGAGGAAWG